MVKKVAAIGPAVSQVALAYGNAGDDATSVSELSGLPIVSAGGSALEVQIANAASLSDGIDLGNQRLHTIVLPAAWTAASISFQISVDGDSWADLYHSTGEVALPIEAVAPGRAVVVDPAVFFAFRFIRIRSGNATAPVAQGAARTLTLLTVAR